MVGKSILEMACDRPAAVHHLSVVLDDRNEMLSTQRTDACHIGEACRDHLGIGLLMGERVANAPGEWADTPPRQSHPLMKSQPHHVMHRPAAMVRAPSRRYRY